jgi:H+/Cl- antiporter ClcA
MKNTKVQTAGLLHSWYDIKLSLFFGGILVGAFAGAITVAFRLLIEGAGSLRENIYQYLSGGHAAEVIGWFALLVLVGLILGLLAEKRPMIGGSGIPQVKGYLLRQFRIDWLKDLLGKFAGGVLALGFGLSLGREGPSIQLGSCAGKGVGRLLKRPEIEEKYLVLGGAGAGLAAAFNAPLAGIIFVIEELQRSLSPAMLICVACACVTSDFISKQVVGLSPVFAFSDITALPLGYYPLLLALGVLCGVLAKVFNLAITRLSDLYAKIPKQLAVIKPGIPLMIVGVLGFFVPDLLGGGQGLIVKVSGIEVDLVWVTLLIAAKLLLTAVCYGSGVPGGIFLPLLVVGALLGKAFGAACVAWLGMGSAYEINFLILGMTAFFAGVVRAPITGTILITEMTGSFQHLLALLTVSMAAYMVTDVIRSFPIYERLLERMLKSGKAAPYDGGSSARIIMEIPVSMGSYLENRRIRDIRWPSKCLIVGVRRGEKEVLPAGDTEILAGDCVIILADREQGNYKMELVGMGQPQ